MPKTPKKPAIRFGTIDEIEPDPDNLNVGTSRGFSMIEESLERHGAGRSIVTDRNLRAIGGNKTRDAWESTGNEKILIVDSPGDYLVVVRRTDLDASEDPEPVTELAIYDNLTTETDLHWSAERLRELKRAGTFERLLNTPELRAAMEGARRQIPKPVTIDRDEDPDDYNRRCPQCGYRWNSNVE